LNTFELARVRAGTHGGPRAGSSTSSRLRLRLKRPHVAHRAAWTWFTTLVLLVSGREWARRSRSPGRRRSSPRRRRRNRFRR